MNRYWVSAGDYGWVSVDEVEFLDCSEDPMGFDVMTFEYKGETFHSRVVGGSRPG